MDAQTPRSRPRASTSSAVFLRADWVVKVVLIGLALASLWSWAVIIDKLVALRRAEPPGQPLRATRSARAARWRTSPPRPASDPRQALPRMLQAALRDWREARAKGLCRQTETQAALLLQRIDRVLDSIIARESQRVEDGPGHAWPSSPPPRRSSACSARSGASCTPSRPSRSRRTPTCRWSPRRSPRPCSPPPSAWPPPSRPTSPTTSSRPTPASSPAGWRASPTSSSTAIQRRLAERSA